MKKLLLSFLVGWTLNLHAQNGYFFPNKKFNPSASEEELNILSVSCDDAEDMQLWYYYMFKEQGLFQEYSFWQHSDYENVDLVLLNNLYFKFRYALTPLPLYMAKAKLYNTSSS